jgi:endonuclease/exonuclease/phosphatase (EEP) superfamily protein YafD
MAMPARPAWSQVVKAVALVGLAWTWLLLPRLGGLGELASIAAPALFAGVLAVHAVTLALRRRLIVAISALAWLVSATVMVVSPRIPTHFAPPQHPVTLVAANLLYSNPTPREAAQDVQARGADVVVISEGTPEAKSVLSAAYAYHRTSRYHVYSQPEFVASRYPLRVRPVPRELFEALVVEVMAPVPFILVAVHLPRAGIDLPHLRREISFADQRRAVSAMLRLTDSSRLPVVVAGDLNISDRTDAYRRLVSHRRDAMRARWAGSTYRPFPWNLLGLRIDHVIIDRSWCAARPGRFHPTGSDHEAVQVTIGPCPGLAPSREPDTGLSAQKTPNVQ